MTMLNRVSAFFLPEQRMGCRKSARILWVAFAAMSILVLGAMPLTAAPILWNLTYEFSGATPPDGTLTVRLTDLATDVVLLNVDATGLVGSEFVCDLALNVNTDPTTLTFLDLGGAFSYYTVDIKLGEDAFKADGDGLYDIDLDFGNSKAKRLSAGEEANFAIAAAGLTADSFDVLSTPAGGHGPFVVAAHIQGIGPDGNDSGWVTTRNGDGCVVPEASTMLLFGSGLVGMLGFLKRRIPVLKGR